MIRGGALGEQILAELLLLQECHIGLKLRHQGHLASAFKGGGRTLHPFEARVEQVLEIVTEMGCLPRVFVVGAIATLLFF